MHRERQVARVAPAVQQSAELAVAEAKGVGVGAAVAVHEWEAAEAAVSRAEAADQEWAELVVAEAELVAPWHPAAVVCVSST